jgi:hypothetical protein
MISFRYHLVSIVAIFLALALGVLMGTTVVNQGVIDDLNRRTEAAVKRADTLKGQLDDLETQLGRWDRFGDLVQPALLAGQLAGRGVTLVTLEGVDVAEIDGVRSALEESGASVTAVVVVKPRMALTDEASQAELATLLGTEVSDSTTLSAAAARALGSRLSEGSVLGAEDILQLLVSRSFVAVLAGSISSAGGTDQAVVMLAGGGGDPVVAPESFLMPLAASLVEAGRPVAAVETVDSQYEFVSLIRVDRSVDGRLVTVDDADQLTGRIALVLGLRDLFLSPGRGGDYGVKDGASGGLIPKP